MYFNITTVLTVINIYRSYHCVPPFTWSSSLTDYAQRWSDTLATNDGFYHSRGPYGETLSLIGAGGAYSGQDKTNVVINAIDMWYNEISLYDWELAMFTMETGHFSQVIWKNTRQIGIAIAANSRGNIVVTAEYYPPGNIDSRPYFLQNVLPLCVPPFNSPPPFTLIRNNPVVPFYRRSPPQPGNPRSPRVPRSPPQTPPDVPEQPLRPDRPMRYLRPPPPSPPGPKPPSPKRGNGGSRTVDRGSRCANGC